MTIDIWEWPDSRGGSDTAMSRKYGVKATGSDAGNETTILAALISYAPTVVAGMVYRGMTLEETDSQVGLWEATASYGEAQAAAQEPTDSYEYRFNFSAPSAHVYQSLATIQAQDASGALAADKGYKGAINVVNDGGKLRVEGYNIAPPPETFTLIYYPANAIVTAAYQNTIEGMVGTVNSTSYKGRAAGSLFLSRVAGGAKDNTHWSIEYGFASIKNRTDVPVGPDITIPSKDGTDLLWAYYDDEVGGDSLIKAPSKAFVERIWYREDFADLGV